MFHFFSNFLLKSIPYILSFLTWLLPPYFPPSLLCMHFLQLSWYYSQLETWVHTHESLCLFSQCFCNSWHCVITILLSFISTGSGWCLMYWTIQLTHSVTDFITSALVASHFCCSNIYFEIILMHLPFCKCHVSQYI